MESKKEAPKKMESGSGWEMESGCLTATGDELGHMGFRSMGSGVTHHITLSNSRGNKKGRCYSKSSKDLHDGG